MNETKKSPSPLIANTILNDNYQIYHNDQIKVQRNQNINYSGYNHIPP
jgi:hypothetical protein